MKPVELDPLRPELTKEGKIFYHGTCSVAAEAILREGLIPGKGKGADSSRYPAECSSLEAAVFDYIFKNSHIRHHKGSFVFLAPRPECAATYAQYAAVVADGHPIIFKVKIPQSFYGKVSRFDDYEYRFEGAIPPEWVSVLSNPPYLYWPTGDIGRLDLMRQMTLNSRRMLLEGYLSDVTGLLMPPNDDDTRAMQKVWSYILT
jgi:hypothetical protein